MLRCVSVWTAGWHEYLEAAAQVGKRSISGWFVLLLAKPFQERKSRDLLGGPEIRAVSFRNDLNERSPQAVRLGVGLTCGVDMDSNPD